MQFVRQEQVVEVTNEAAVNPEMSKEEMDRYIDTRLLKMQLSPYENKSLSTR